MIDLHSHLDLYSDALNLAKQASERNLFTLVVTTSPRAWLVTRKKFSVHRNIRVALGMHPEIVEQKIGEKDLLRSLIKDTEFVGEVGLDGSCRFRSSYAQQEEVFRCVLSECSSQGGRIISIHSRGAAGHVLDLLMAYPKSGIPILHWFSGSLSELEIAIDLGCWFSVGPAMLASTNGRKLARKIPLSRLLPESDGPFARRGEVPFYPWDACDIIDEIASSRNLDSDVVRQEMKANLRNLLLFRQFKG